MNLGNANPLDFDLEKFTAAVEKHTGASRVNSLLKAFEIVFKYEVTNTADLHKLKSSIAKASGVLENDVNLERSGRRLRSNSFLVSQAIEVDITIMTADAETAARVLTAVTDLVKVVHEFGQEVSLAESPVARAKVETTFTNDPSFSAKTFMSKMSEASKEVGGTITVTEMAVDVPRRSSSALSSVGAPVTAFAILLAHMLLM